MFFPVITLLTSLALAAVAGWFSIAGLVTIMAGQPLAALVLGLTLESGKLVTASWLYRNWQCAGWYIKTPLLYFMAALMLTTSMGVFGYLSKAHLEQGAATIDNSAKVEDINRRIAKEQQSIDDNTKMVAQLDAVVDTLIAKEQTARALSVRRSQAAQRSQLKTANQELQQNIDALAKEKFQLESQLRQLEMEVGPIKYIATLIYGTDNTDTLASAVRIFILLVVSTLDPLAITLLIAANHSLLRLREENQQTQVSAVALPTNLDQTVAAVPESIAEPIVEPPPEPETPVPAHNDPLEITESPPAATDNSVPDATELLVEPQEQDNITPMPETTETESRSPKTQDATAEEIREFLESLCKPQNIGHIVTPAVTQVVPVVEKVSNTSTTPESAVIMSDTVRELKGSHFVPEPLVVPDSAKPVPHAVAQGNPKTARSWITSYKDTP